MANLPVAAVGFALTVAAWGGSVAMLTMLTMPIVVDDLPGGTAKFWFFELHPGAGAWFAALAGVVGLGVVAPWLTVGVARAELALAKSLLGRTAAQAHAAEVSRLETRSRAAVDSAETERRRIERDLHDGATATGRPGRQPGGGPREARSRRDPGGTPDGGRGPRGGEGRAQGPPRPRARRRAPTSARTSAG